MAEKRTLYRVSFDTERSFIREYTPRVPSAVMQGEDKVTPRVCFAESVEQCIAALPGDRRRRYFDIGQPLIVFPYTVDTDDPEIIPPEKLDKDLLVPDAAVTREYWLLRPVILKGIPMRVTDFAVGNYFFASENHRCNVYAVMQNHGLSQEVIHEFDNVPVFDIVNNHLNSDPRFWPLDSCFGDLVAEEAGIPNNIIFDYLNLEKIDTPIN